MPTSDRRPRRRLTGASAAPDFASEADVRAAAELVRARFPTIAEAEASDAWRSLRPRVVRWILRTAGALPAVRPEDAATQIARIYLRAPHLLPMLPPAMARGLPQR
jgi:hypothetical protein